MIAAYICEGVRAPIGRVGGRARARPDGRSGGHPAGGIAAAISEQRLASVCAAGAGRDSCAKSSGRQRKGKPPWGAIALGHPLGMSGARLVSTAARQLRRTGLRYAVASMCIGGGPGHWHANGACIEQLYGDGAERGMCVLRVRNPVCEQPFLTLMLNR
jgi:hypothetical protein